MRTLQLAVGVLVAAGHGPVFGDDLKPVETVRSVNGQCSVVFEAAVRDNDFPAGGPKITLRSPTYVLREANGLPKDVAALVGPVIRVGKGDGLRIVLKNRLRPDMLPPELPNPPHNYPQGYAVTNLHTHGLHVSPAGKADNIYVEIQPDKDWTFEYQVLPNHPAGTFWYHPHKHGSVALQITGGMAGALIVEGDTDDIPEVRKAAEHVLVLQQFHGSLDPGDPTGKRLVARPGDIYDKLKSAAALAANRPVPQRSWRALNAIQKLQEAKAPAPGPTDASAVAACRAPEQNADTKDQEWLLVNGQWLPTIRMKPGEIQRWRFIHAGLDEVINLAVVEKKDGKNIYHPLQEIAVDGLPRGRKVPRLSNLLYPAYRWDVLFKAPDVEPGKETVLCLLDDQAPADVTLSGFTKLPQLIARVVVSGPQQAMSLPSDDALAQAVPSDFRVPISDREVGNRRWVLKFDFPDHGPADPSQFLIDGHQYSGRIDRVVRLNTAEEWWLESGTGRNNGAGHPFHVHVNPFLHYVYRDVLALNFNALPDDLTPMPDTKLTRLGYKPGDTITFSGRVWSGDSFSSSTTVTGDATVTTLATNLRVALNAKNADSYTVDLGQVDCAGVRRFMVVRALKGQPDDLSITYRTAAGDVSGLSFTHARELVDAIWRDTLLAPSGRTEVVRMRFRDWTGDSVLHCHIVDHEDQGMMKNIRILGPDDPAPPEGAEADGHGKRGSARAPDFELFDADGKRHTLNEFAGKPLVLVFFRDSGCVHCVEQLRAYRTIENRLRDEKVSVVAIGNGSPDDLKAIRASLPGLSRSVILLLSDSDQVAFRRYGCIDDRGKEPLHGTFVVDPQGIIVWHHVGDAPYMNMTHVVATAAQRSTSRSAK